MWFNLIIMQKKIKLKMNDENENQEEAMSKRAELRRQEKTI